jgi:hypothetical protein
MGYYDGILSSYFKKDPNGNTVFIFNAKRLLDLNGIFKSQNTYQAYVIPDPALESYLRRRLKICYIFMIWGLPIIYASIMPFLIPDNIFPGIFFMALIAVSITSLILSLFWLSIRSKVNPLTKTSITVSRNSNMESAAKQMGINVVILITLGSLIFIVGGFIMLFASTQAKYVGILSILFFGLCFAYSVKMLKFFK